MRIYYSIDGYAAEGRSSSVALGYFDGVHEGHRAVLRRCVEAAGDAQAVALTFAQNPAAALGRKAPPLLTDNTRKAELMAELGIDAVIFADFDSIKDMSAGDFVRGALRDKLRAAGVCCGYDYRFGRGGSGDTDVLRALCADEDIGVCVVSPEVVDGDTASSTRIRELLAEGCIGRANRMLGYRYAVTGEIQRGNRVGHALGYPTLNLVIGEGLCVPRYGVYASVVRIGGRAFGAVTNIGVHPTVGEAESALCESFLTDFHGGEMYGQRAVCELAEFIRPEMRFASERELKEQIGRDVEMSREML